MSVPVSTPVQHRAMPPCSVGTWLSYLWTRLLFPGTVPRLEPIRWPAVLLLVLLPGALLYPCLAFHLFEPDEGRYAQIPREMLERGDWIVPTLQGQPYLDKPPLLYWSVMISYAVFGVHDWAARVPPALAVHGCILLSYLLGRRLLGERSAFWGALLLALAPGFVSVGRLLVLDGVLTFWIWLSLLAALCAVQAERLHRGWWLLAAVATALGVLTKGPIAVVLLLPPLWLHLRLMNRHGLVRCRDWLGFAIIVSFVNLPWYVLVSLREPSFPRYFFWEHNLVRFLDPFDHQQPIWFYGPILLGGLLPGTLLLLSFCRFLLASDSASAGRRSSELGYFILAGLWCVGFFSLSGCKLPTYVLPAFPAFALALGCYLAGSRWAISTWPTVVGVVTALLLGVTHYVAVPWYAWHRSPMGRAEGVLRQHAAPDLPIVCYPRPCDSAAFYLGRDDLLNFRSKELTQMLLFMQQRPRTLVLFTHRHSLKSLKPLLPADLRVCIEAPLFGSAKLGPAGDCYLAVVERRPQVP